MFRKALFNIPPAPHPKKERSLHKPNAGFLSRRNPLSDKQQEATCFYATSGSISKQYQKLDPETCVLCAVIYTKF